MQRATVFSVLLALGFLTPAGSADASPRKTPKHKKARREPKFTGHLVPLSEFRSEPLPKPSGNLKLVNINFRDESLEVNIYKPDGSFNEDALDRLNHFWRCKRTGTEKPINPHLFEILSHVYDHFQSPIELVSGFRNQQHTSSFHFHGSASDIRVQGVSPDVVYAYVTTLDAGGMGIGRYPRAQFVHVDVRPEPSFRWVDRSAPGSSHPSKKAKSKKRHEV